MCLYKPDTSLKRIPAMKESHLQVTSFSLANAAEQSALLALVETRQIVILNETR